MDDGSFVGSIEAVGSKVAVEDVTDFPKACSLLDWSEDEFKEEPFKYSIISFAVELAGHKLLKEIKSREILSTMM